MEVRELLRRLASGDPSRTPAASQDSAWPTTKTSLAAVAAGVLRFCTFSPEISWDLDVARGAPIESIVDQAPALQADMIVATTGPEIREGPEVLCHVADRAPCPVLIVPLQAGPAAAGERAHSNTPDGIPER